jgi:hypothetical protein
VSGKSLPNEVADLILGQGQFSGVKKEEGRAMYGRDRLPYPCLYPPFYRLQGRTWTTTNLFGNWTSFEKKKKKEKIAVMSAGKAELSGDGTAQQTHTAADGEIRGKEGNIEPVSSDAR